MRRKPVPREPDVSIIRRYLRELRAGAGWKAAAAARPDRHPPNVEDVSPGGAEMASAEPAGPGETRWAWPAMAGSVSPARGQVVAYATDLGIRGPLLDDIRLAVSEACTNVVVHAYVGAEPGAFTVTAHRQWPDLIVAVRDHGSGTHPRPDSPGMGLGLPLMATLCRGLEITTPANGGTKVVMRFAIDGSE